MRTFDFSPLYRSTVGFDRLFSMLDSVSQPEGQTYPPYNIERTGEDAYRISMAVAGFSDAEISIEAHRNVLTVKGERKEEADNDAAEVLYRGIAARAFERRFQLADHVEVAGAALKNGLLHIDLKRNVPEELKPRKIAISNGAAAVKKQIEAKAAALASICRAGPPLVMPILRGFSSSGTLRFRSMCSRPFFSAAPVTSTWSASWKRRSKVRAAMPR
jgi:molecular chaperone IbpA